MNIILFLHHLTVYILSKSKKSHNGPLAYYSFNEDFSPADGFNPDQRMMFHDDRMRLLTENMMKKKVPSPETLKWNRCGDAFTFEERTPELQAKKEYYDELGGEDTKPQGIKIEMDPECLALTSREIEMMDIEQLLSSKVELHELLRVLENLRSTHPSLPVLNTDFLSSTSKLLPHVVVLDTTVVMLHRNLVNQIKNLPNISVVVPILVYNEINLLHSTENRKINEHAREAKIWIKQEFEHTGMQLEEDTENKKNVKGNDPALTIAQILMKITRDYKFKKCTVFSCDPELLSYSWDRQVLVAAQDRILYTIENRTMILEKVRDKQGVKVFIELGNNLRDLLEVVLVSELEKFYAKDWIKIVKVKPAKTHPYWNLTGLFEALARHHEAVFSVYFPDNGSSLIKCLSSLSQILETNCTPRRKVDDLIPEIIQLCRLVERRGELPKSPWFPVTNLENALSIMHKTKVIKSRWRGNPSNQVYSEASEFEQNEERENIHQHSWRWDDDDKDITEHEVSDNDDNNSEENENEYENVNENKNEDENENDEDNEEEENNSLTLLTNVWHMIASVSYGLCSTWECAEELEPVEPEYNFKDRGDAENYLQGFFNQVHYVLGLITRLVQRKKSGELEQGREEGRILVQLLISFKQENSVKDEQAGVHIPYKYLLELSFPSQSCTKFRFQTHVNNYFFVNLAVFVH